jgi:hypothetical protein
MADSGYCGSGEKSVGTREMAGEIVRRVAMKAGKR